MHAIFARRALNALVVVGFATGPGPSWAKDDSAGPYHRIEPQAPNSDLGAAFIVTSCIDIKDQKNPPRFRTQCATGEKVVSKDASPAPQSQENLPSMECCTAWRAALAFCEKPLDFATPRPNRSLLADLAANRCPTRTPSPLNTRAKAAGLLGSNWQNAVIEGLAAFLIERAKAEAMAAAADRLRTELCGKEVAKRILPLTCTLLLSADPYTVPVSWGAVKTTLERDFHALPLRILDLGLPRMTAKAKDAPELLYAAVDILERVMAENQPPLPLLVGLKSKYQGAAKSCDWHPAACTLLAAGIASEVVIPGFDAQNAQKNRADFVPIAARIILDQAIAVGLLDVATANALSAKVVTAIDNIASALTPMESLGSAATADGASAAEIGAYATALGQLVWSLSSGLGRQLVATPVALDGIEKALQAWPILMQASLHQDYLTAALQLYTLWYAVEGDKVPSWIGRYLPVLAELAEAKKPEQAKEVLQAIAAPAGGYRGKRGSGNGLRAINAYVGAQGGWEWLGGGDVPRARSLQGGIFAPVGVESSWGLGKSTSLGVLLTVLDLGAVVNFRSSSESSVQGSGSDAAKVEQKPEIGLSQVFSPGIYGLWGIGGSPLVFGVGAALTPELRRVTLLATGTTEKATALRFGAFLAIDITLLPF